MNEKPPRTYHLSKMPKGKVKPPDYRRVVERMSMDALMEEISEERGTPGWRSAVRNELKRRRK